MEHKDDGRLKKDMYPIEVVVVVAVVAILGAAVLSLLGLI